MERKPTLTKYRALKLTGLIAVSLFWVACKPSEMEFQRFEPKSETALSDLFNDTPAIRAAFTTVEPHEFNVRLDRLIQADPVMGVKMMHALGVLSKEKPALPQLADSVSSVIDRFARYYQATPARKAEYNAAVDLVNRLLDVDPKAITDGAYLLARMVRYTGESNSLFADSLQAPDFAKPNDRHFPALTTWRVCDDSGSVFLGSQPMSTAPDIEARDMLWGLYDILRTGFCIYANRSGPRVEITGDGTGAKAEAIISESVITGFTITNPGSGYTNAVVTIDASPGPGSGATATATISSGQITALNLVSGGSAYVPKSDNSPGAFMRNATAVMKNSGDVELRIRNIINDLSTKLDDYSKSEKNIADWTVNNSNDAFRAQTAVVDYIIDHIYPITRKDFVFNDGKDVLDREAEHLSMPSPRFSWETPDNDTYLTEWLLKSLNTDAPKIDELERFSDVDTTSALYKFGKDMVENPVYGINAVTSRYAQNDLRMKLWDGWEYTCNCTAGSYTFTDRKFKGLLKEGGSAGWTDDGYITQLLQISSTQNNFNHYRQQMGTAISSLVTVPATYNNESFMESFLKNYYYFVANRYYNQTQSKWSFTPEDGQNYFTDASRNLQSYFGHMQYSLRNTMILDKNGKKPGDAGFDNIPYLASFLYTVAGANGYVDKDTTPERLTLADCLRSNGSTIGTTVGGTNPGYGQKIINLPWPLDTSPMILQVTDGPAAQGRFYAYRNGLPFTASMGMSAFELLSPGRFIPRDGSTHYFDTSPHQDLTSNGRWRGKFSAHQGMVEDVNPGQANRTADWMMNEFTFAGWQGYGPYTIKGKAANGSKIKYQNDFYTDNYKTSYDIGHTFGDSDFVTSPMGWNQGDANNSWLAGEGNYHIYEHVYRPMSAGDPCWSDAQGTTYGYARYGYLRPHNNPNYHDVTNCNTWTKVRVDFDTMEEAVRSNIEWVLKYKKYVFVIPMWGQTNKPVGINNGASFSVFSTINANGLYGVTRAKRAGSSPSNNGRWTHSCADTDGLGLPCVAFPLESNNLVVSNNVGTGLEDESPANGAVLTKRYGKTSFYPSDSLILMDVTLNTWGLSSLLINIFNELWGSLGDGYVTPQLLLDNMDSVLALVNAKYTESDVSASVAPLTASSLNKFQRFYDMMFPTDDEHWDAVTGRMVAGCNNAPTCSPKVPDLYERYSHALIKDIEMPPVPRVQGSTNCNEIVPTTSGCVTYPATYNSVTGAVQTWVPYTGPSDGKFTGILVPLVMMFGTMQEDGTIYKVTGNPYDINNSTTPIGTPLAANENSDNVQILNYASNGYRTQFAVIFDALASLNESQRIGGAGANKNLPAYNNSSLVNILTESAAGLRDGLFPKLVTNKYANVAYLDPLIQDIESLVSDNIRKAENRFRITSEYSGTGDVKDKDRLRYFATKNAVKPSFTATISVGTPATVVAKNHGLSVNDLVYFTTTGSLPAGLTASTKQYYVIPPVTSDSFRISERVANPAPTPPTGRCVADFSSQSYDCTGVTAVATTAPGAGTHTVNQVLFETNRFDQTVNGTALNSVPINMMKEFVKYLRTLTSDAEIVAAIKAAIPMLNNYLDKVQNSNSQISLTDADIDHVVSFIRDTSNSGDYTVDAFLDMLVATKMEDLNTLRAFNFDQFKTLGSYQTVFDDMNDKINKYFEIDIKKDILFSPFMLGEPTCPGGSANGFYDHNGDGVWDPGTFTFISAAYAGAPNYTDTANVGGSCAITTPVPNIYDKNYYMLDMGGVAKNMKKAATTITLNDITSKLDWLYGRPLTGGLSDVQYKANPNNGNKVECFISSSGSSGAINFDNEVKAFKNLLLCQLYTKKVDEPHYDRNGNNIIEAGEFTDIPHHENYTDSYIFNGTTSGIYEGKDDANAINLRDILHYYLEDVFVPKYAEYIQPDVMSPQKNYVNFAANALRDLLAPTVCDAGGLNCGVNANYVTADLLSARATLYASTNFTSTELKSVKNVVGNFLYDQESTNTDSDCDTPASSPYTCLMKRTGPHLATVLREFEGDYNDLLNTGLEGFKSDGFLTYFSTNLKNKDPYNSLDILSDVRTLFNTRVMRCYPGITGEYPTVQPHCKQYKALDTFWGQFGLLMDQFSTAAYNKYKTQWQSQMSSPYYAKLVSIFE